MPYFTVSEPVREHTGVSMRVYGTTCTPKSHEDMTVQAVSVQWLGIVSRLVTEYPPSRATHYMRGRPSPSHDTAQSHSATMR